jgi:hypothetical protein
MDETLDGLKQWKDAKGHVLGVIRREKIKTKLDDGEEIEYHTSVLIIFRKAIDLESASMDDVDVGGTLYARLLLGFQWKCSVPGCDCIRYWHPDDDALDWLQKRYRKEKV